MTLQQFLPYRLAVLADAVSRAMASVYQQRFDLTRDEWRLLAVLGDRGRLQAAEAAQATTVDKMQASRALRRLQARGLVSRQTDPDDRRHVIVQLLPAGRSVLQQLNPVIQAREAYLLDALSEPERELLDRALDRLLQRAHELQQL